jgi:hypothetical protein
VKPVLRYAKAIGGAVLGGVGAYLSAKDGGVTMSEWWSIIGAALVGGGVIATIPNAAKQNKPPA